MDLGHFDNFLKGYEEVKKLMKGLKSSGGSIKQISRVLRLKKRMKKVPKKILSFC